MTRAPQPAHAPARAANVSGLLSARRIAASGFVPCWRTVASGFSLVEMMVALSIFAIVSTAGVMLLRTSIDTQGAVASQMTADSAISRLHALLASDLLAAQPRPGRAPDGTMRPALSGNEEQMSVVYANEGNGDEAGVARATYRLFDGALVRDGTAHVDGERAGAPAIIVRNVTAAHWRYRGVDGSWSANWASDRPDRLPRAVELVIARQRQPPLVMQFLVAPDGLAVP